jgi:hypothetical protein
MNDVDHKTVQAYITSVARQMGLRDWETKLSEEPCEDSTDAATVVCTYGQRRLTIKLATDFRKQSAVDQRDTIVHELVHAHFDPCLGMVDDDLESQLGGGCARVVRVRVPSSS